MEALPISPILNFSEFQSLDLNQWMERIHIDLKDKNWEDYQWEIEPGLTMDPAQFDLKQSYAPIFKAKENSWIGHELEVKGDLEASNKELLALLMLGISAPVLRISNVLSNNDWEELFDNVKLEYLQVQLHFKSYDVASKSLDSLATVYSQGDGLSGAVSIENSENGDKELMKYHSLFPKLRFYSISTGDHSIVDSLAEILIATNRLVQESIRTERNTQETFDNIQIQMNIGNSFLVEIAKLRAVRLLMNLIADLYSLDNSNVKFQIATNANAFSGEVELDVIRMTSMTLAANLGGADQIQLPNLDKERKEFLQRITTNIQHLLNLESHLGKVGDPMAGSHYLEALTERIAEQAWAKFQTKAYSN